MFKLIFEILTDPLGLPIEWYWEYLILTVIGAVAYAVAYRCVGDMYSGGMIDGSTSGSFFHSPDSVCCSVGSYLRNHCSSKMADG